MTTNEQLGTYLNDHLAGAHAGVEMARQLQEEIQGEPDAEVLGRLAEEIARVVRGRLTNPRWLAGMLAHGHRGVAEIAQEHVGLFHFIELERLDNRLDFFHRNCISRQLRGQVEPPTWLAGSVPSPASFEKAIISMTYAMAAGLLGRPFPMSCLGNEHNA